MANYQGFGSWDDLLAYLVDKDGNLVHHWLFYKARPDNTPRMVKVLGVFGRGIMVDPVMFEADPFMAEEKELASFLVRK